ncbi:MAG: formylglycine-generating enzyme family protein [Anaerolineae bacterium]|jgi:formylglycine-generating enzyme required for sulfatase activity|nr:formylglycine-generating enzyme family protein [Anaerolineae bacterium]
MKIGYDLEITVTDVCKLSFVWCNPGMFVMGLNNTNNNHRYLMASPPHPVEITKGFWISRFLITQEQWLVIMGEQSPLYVQGEHLPADCDWDEANNFCNSLQNLLVSRQILEAGYQVTLPTEAQWEYACRAGTSTFWYFGDDPDELKKHAWYSENSPNKKQSVGQKLPNPWGIYDLYGNMAEWCQDNSWVYPKEPVLRQDPVTIKVDSNLMVTRGAEYNSLQEELGSSIRWAELKHNPYREPIGLRPVIS